MAMNKTIFDEKWMVIRDRSTTRWSLMSDFDHSKVDKADNKYDRFLTMLQVKYGYTRQQARAEVKSLWEECEANSKADL